jgi:hypothetical protein
MSDTEQLLALQRQIDDLKRQLGALRSFGAIKTGMTVYTPTWTASVSNPAIGDGSLSGRYIRRGKLCLLRMQMIAGASTTFGSGNWSFSIPFQVAAGGFYMGIARLYDNGAAYYTKYMPRLSGDETALLSFFSDGSTIITLTAAYPFTWTANDSLFIQIEYEVA